MSRPRTINSADATRHSVGMCGVRSVRWAISPDALRAYAPAVLNGHASELAAAELRVDLEPARAALVLAYSRGDRVEHALSVATSAAVITRDEARDLVHIELPGALLLCLRAGVHAPAAIVYAQTPLLAAIGLPGGVYDVPTIARNDED